MKIALTERFQQDVHGLDSALRGALFEVILNLPWALREVHRHTGLGIRKLHPSGIWEARVGLGLRLVFMLEEGTCVLVRVGSHDEIRRYLRSL